MQHYIDVINVVLLCRLHVSAGHNQHVKWDNCNSTVFSFFSNRVAVKKLCTRTDTNLFQVVTLLTRFRNVIHHGAFHRNRMWDNSGQTCLLRKIIDFSNHILPRIKYIHVNEVFAIISKNDWGRRFRFQSLRNTLAELRCEVPRIAKKVSICSHNEQKAVECTATHDFLTNNL